MKTALPDRRQVMAGLGTLSLLACAARAEPVAPLDAAFAHAGGLGQLRTLIVARGGVILRSETFHGPGPDVPVNVKSVSKSLISALTGIAIARGELSGTGQTVAPLLRRAVPRRADPRVKVITVGHLLSMRSGLQRVSGAAYGDWVGGDHWIYTALSKPMVADPGTAMLYSTASYHILGAVLSAVSGRDLHALAVARLGAPLGIEIPRWTQDPRGRYLGGNDMRISPLAMLRFGEMYRNGGLHDGIRILRPGWIGESWIERGQSEETGHGYGYGWFLWSAGGHRVAYARGYGGQMIYIMPDLGLTVVMTSNPARPATLDGHLGALNDLFARHIVPAIETMG